MRIINTNITDVKIVEPDVFGDARGYFFEAWNSEKYSQCGINCRWIQDNESCSGYGVLRGLHYQLPPYAQAKLVRVISGKVLDVAVDIRQNSPTFGQYTAVELSGENKRQLFIPRGFAHGFAVLSEKAIFSYKCDNIYHPASERGIAFNDPDLAIDWQIDLEKALLSAKDTRHPPLSRADLFDYNTREDWQ